MFSQTQQSYSMLFIDLERHVSIPLESSSGPLWKNTDPLRRTIVLCNGSVIFQRGPDDDSKGIETCRPRSVNNILYDCCVWLNIVVYYIPFHLSDIWSCCENCKLIAVSRFSCHGEIILRQTEVWFSVYESITVHSEISWLILYPRIMKC